MTEVRSFLLLLPALALTGTAHADQGSSPSQPGAFDFGDGAIEHVLTQSISLSPDL